mgnify:CR=1 FL=1
MKSLLILLALITSATFSYSQTTDWKEMKEFHAVMSKTFHPAEDNNLQPTKNNAAELLTIAKAWQKSTAPAGYNATVAKPILKQLVKDCKEVKKAVAANKTDAELKVLITKAHETFHELTEKCKPGEEEKH